ncbi:glutaredoxin family protein [bacterium]|nr:glutaredoxin family protein [bacterium]
MVDPKSQSSVVIYTRQGCHLCEDAERLVRSLVSDCKLIDIDRDSELRQKFNTCVPVVEINGKVRFRGRVEPLLLRRTLKAEAAADRSHPAS